MFDELSLINAFLLYEIQGETLGEVKEGEEEVASAADWVKRSRKKAIAMEEERLLAKQRSR